MPPSASTSPRVALFADTFFEANGVATLGRQLACFARDRGFPMLVVRSGQETGWHQEESLEWLELKRGVATFPLDKDLYCDPLLMRYRHLVMDQLLIFKPELIHITGPGDFGFLGLWAAHALRVPLVASWHTNLHEYLSRRLERALSSVPRIVRDPLCRFVERQSLRGLLTFYRTARFLLAPNEKLLELLRARTGKPAYLMPHGVDLATYAAVPIRSDSNGPFCIGYVGRLTTEKNVRSLVDLERNLLAAGERDFKLLIVGEGGQRQWLEKHLKNVEFTGVLRDKHLIAAYSRMHALVFPSRTDTFGLVVLEAMASGVPVVLSPETGRNVGIEDGISGLLSTDFAASLRRLMHDRPLQLAMSSAARQAANGHSWQAAFEQLYRVYARELIYLASCFRENMR